MSRSSFDSIHNCPLYETLSLFVTLAFWVARWKEWIQMQMNVFDEVGVGN